MCSLYLLQDVTKKYDKRTVLTVDELLINRGEILAIVGPSGSGKSTLLRLLNFLDTPTSGAISYLGQQYSAASPPTLAVRRRITTVFQHPALLKRSVYANVAYGLQLRRINYRNNEADEPVLTALKQLGLESLSNQSAHTLSGGEMQRVALARSIVLNPEVLLLDEPTANLDPQNVTIIESIVKMMNQKQQTTVVLVTHNIFQARRLAHRVAFLLDGEIIEIGPTSQIFNAPVDARTSAFIQGDMVY